MDTLIILIPAIVLLAAFGAAMWFIGKLSDAEVRGEHNIKDALTEEALTAKSREAKDYAAPRPKGWGDIVDKL